MTALHENNAKGDCNGAAKEWRYRVQKVIVCTPMQCMKMSLKAPGLLGGA